MISLLIMVDQLPISEKPSGKYLKVFAETLRQQTRVSLVSPIDAEGWHPSIIGLGEDLESELWELEEKWKDKPEPENHDPSHSFWDEYQYLKLWLFGQEEGVRTIEWVKEKDDQILTIGELASIRKLVLEKIANNSIGKELFESSGFNKLVSKTWIKLNVINEVIDMDDDSTSRYLQDRVNAGIKFIQDNLLTGNQPTELNAIYATRYKRVLSNGGPGRARTTQERLQLLQCLAKKNEYNNEINIRTKLGVKIETDILRLAGALNLQEMHDRLAHDKNIDWKKLRDKVSELPPDEGGANELIDTLTPIMQFFIENFPHDHAYLLGQSLEYGQAVCAGKELMFLMVVRELLHLHGRYSNVHLLSEVLGRANHVVTQIPWGSNLLIEIDLNYRDDESDQKCVTSVLKKEGESRSERPDILEFAQLTDGQYHLSRGTYQLYRRINGKACHRLVSGENCPEDYLEYFNLSQLYSNTSIFRSLDHKTRRDLIIESAELAKKMKLLDPDDPMADL